MEFCLIIQKNKNFSKKKEKESHPYLGILEDIEMSSNSSELKDNESDFNESK